MKFTPKSADEIAAEQSKFGPWPRGAYAFEVAAAEDATSKKGNEMITLELMIYDQDGNRRTIKDWLVETVPVKLKHACDAVGLHEAYANGNVVSHDFIGRSGKLMLGIERQVGYDDRNKVTDYVPVDSLAKTAKAPAKRQKAPAGDIDDDIPF